MTLLSSGCILETQTALISPLRDYPIANRAEGDEQGPSGRGCAVCLKAGTASRAVLDCREPERTKNIRS